MSSVTGKLPDFPPLTPRDVERLIYRFIRIGGQQEALRNVLYVGEVQHMMPAVIEFQLLSL